MLIAPGLDSTFEWLRRAAWCQHFRTTAETTLTLSHQIEIQVLGKSLSQCWGRYMARYRRPLRNRPSWARASPQRKTFLDKFYRYSCQYLSARQWRSALPSPKPKDYTTRVCILHQRTAFVLWFRTPCIWPMKEPFWFECSRFREVSLIIHHLPGKTC